MIFNQSLLSKIGWGIMGLGLCNVIKDYFNRYEMRDEVLEYAKPEDVGRIYEFFDEIANLYAVLWIIVIGTGILIALMLYKSLPLYSGICAGIATLCCKLLGPVALDFIIKYEAKNGLETALPVAVIASICGMVTLLILAIFLYIYKKASMKEWKRHSGKSEI